MLYTLHRTPVYCFRSLSDSRWATLPSISRN